MTQRVQPGPRSRGQSSRSPRIRRGSRRCGACRGHPRPLRFSRGSGRPCGIAPGVAGSPAAIECTSVVAPPGSTTSKGPSPASADVPSARSLRALQHCGRSRHQHGIEFSLGAVYALGMNDAVDEHFAYRRTRRLDAEHVEFGHDVLRPDDRLVLQLRPRVIGGAAVAGVDDGTVERDLRPARPRCARSPRCCRRRCRRRAAGYRAPGAGCLSCRPW